MSSDMKRNFALLSGPLAFLLLRFTAQSFGSAAASALGMAAWMALWWVFRPVGIAVTALLPIAVNAVLNLIPSGHVIKSVVRYRHIHAAADPGMAGSIGSTLRLSAERGGSGDSLSHCGSHAEVCERRQESGCPAICADSAGNWLGQRHRRLRFSHRRRGKPGCHCLHGTAYGT